MMRRTIWILGAVLLCTAGIAEAQVGILASHRMIDWSKAGVTGGIPNRTTVCATLSPGATVAQINSAIASCPANQVVKLSAGTYTLSSGIDFAGKSNVTLRGEGATTTFLVFTGNTACLGQYSNVCIRGSNLSYYGPGPPTNVVSWTGGYAKGTTSVTLSATTGLAVGMRMVLDQANDSADTGNIYVCQNGGCTQQGGITNGQTNRAQHQIVTVTAISGNTVSFTPALYMPNYRSSQSPQAWWGSSSALASGNGLEDLSMDTTSGQAKAGAIELIFAHNSWVKGVRVINCPTPKACVGLYHVDHVTIRDSYFYGSSNYTVGSTTYGVDLFGTADSLIENNIFHHRTSPFVVNGDQGSVIAYNYSIDDYYSVSANWMQASQYSHEGGNGMVLEEGNEGIGIKGDIIHGTSNLFTFFRNYMHGWEPGKTAETNPVNLYAYNRYWNFIGNVLGEQSYHNVYEGGSKAIWQFGRAYNPVPSDPIAAGTMMRWGNYDVVTGTQFNPSEVPSGLSAYGNPVPSTQSLPASFYLSAKPSWWGTMPWPAIGPDVNGGDVPNIGGKAYKIPARRCYESTAKHASGYLIDFDPGRCYGSTSSGSAPSAPSNLRIVSE